MTMLEVALVVCCYKSAGTAYTNSPKRRFAQRKKEKFISRGNCLLIFESAWGTRQTNLWEISFFFIRKCKITVTIHSLDKILLVERHRLSRRSFERSRWNQSKIQRIRQKFNAISVNIFALRVLRKCEIWNFNMWDFMCFFHRICCKIDSCNEILYNCCFIFCGKFQKAFHRNPNNTENKIIVTC